MPCNRQLRYPPSFTLRTIRMASPPLNSCDTCASAQPICCMKCDLARCHECALADKARGYTFVFCGNCFHAECWDCWGSGPICAFCSGCKTWFCGECANTNEASTIVYCGYYGCGLSYCRTCIITDPAAAMVRCDACKDGICLKDVQKFLANSSGYKGPDGDVGYKHARAQRQQLHTGNQACAVSGAPCTALHEAAEDGLAAVCQLLLDEGASVHTCDWSDSSATAIKAAAAGGHTEAAHVLVAYGEWIFVEWLCTFLKGCVWHSLLLP